MNTNDLIEQHQTAIEMLEDIQGKEREKEILQESIDSISVQNHPKLRRELEDGQVKAQQQIYDAMVDYRCYCNGMRG